MNADTQGKGPEDWFSAPNILFAGPVDLGVIGVAIGLIVVVGALALLILGARRLLGPRYKAK